VHTEVWFERRKWPATPHYGHAALRLGEDEFGTWYRVVEGTPWYRGGEFLSNGEWDATILVPHADGYIAWFWGDGIGQLDLYVDIVTNVERLPESLFAVDLDLDIIRFRDDGRVQLVDEDEFALHQVQLAYPNAVIAHALTVATETVELVRTGKAPFDGVAASRWREVTNEPL
jgi:uncharacterized protein